MCRSEEIEDLIKIAEVLDFGEEGGQSPVSSKIYKKYIEQSNDERLRDLESVEIIDESIFIEKVINFISFFEESLVQEFQKNSFDDIHKAKNLTIMRIHVFEENFKFRVYLLMENIVKDSLEVFLRNAWESHGFQIKIFEIKRFKLQRRK